MMLRALMFIVLLFGSAAQAQQPEHDSAPLTNPMVADISQNTVEIRTSFNGAQLLLFGARNIPGDLIIVVRGPTASISLRRKDRIAGMWMHVDERKYNAMPLFYAVASTKALGRITSPAMLKSLGIGKYYLLPQSTQQAQATFDVALNKALSKKRWWQFPFANITYFGESLFKARLELPDSLPGGTYTAEVYLFDNGNLKAMQTIPLTVYKTGLEASLVNYSQQNGAAYGIAAILMALCGGWLAHRLFHRA